MENLTRDSFEDQLNSYFLLGTLGASTDSLSRALTTFCRRSPLLPSAHRLPSELPAWRTTRGASRETDFLLAGECALLPARPGRGPGGGGMILPALVRGGRRKGDPRRKIEVTRGSVATFILSEGMGAWQERSVGRGPGPGACIFLSGAGAGAQEGGRQARGQLRAAARQFAGGRTRGADVGGDWTSVSPTLLHTYCRYEMFSFVVLCCFSAVAVVAVQLKAEQADVLLMPEFNNAPELVVVQQNC